VRSSALHSTLTIEAPAILIKAPMKKLILVLTLTAFACSPLVIPEVHAAPGKTSVSKHGKKQHKKHKKHKK
jgi:hypothetical protein